MQDTPIVDAHVHVWDPLTTPRTASPLVRIFGRWPRVMNAVARVAIPAKTIRFVGDLRYAAGSFMPEDWAALASPELQRRVRGYIHVEADWSREHGLQLAEETEWLASLNHPPLGAVVGAHLDRDTLDALLDAHESAAGGAFKVVGVRDMLAHSDRPGVHDWGRKGRMFEPAFRDGYRRLGERGLTFDGYVYSEQLMWLAELAAEHPGTKLMLNHVGTPVAVAGQFGKVGATRAERNATRQQWEEGIQAMAELSHVSVKLSGLMMPVVGFGYHQAETRPTIEQVVADVGPYWRYVLDAFGWERCVFASNFPMDAVSVDFDVLVGALEQVIQQHGLDATQRRGVMAGNALRFYGLS